MIDLTVEEIRHKLQACDQEAFAVLERSLEADMRKGVRQAVEVARRRIQAEQEEAQRIASLYAFDRYIAENKGASVILGLDEVGRGPLAGPLAVGGVVLAYDAYIAGLNDSKQVKPHERSIIAHEIHERAQAWTVQFVEAQDIDRLGVTQCLKTAFKDAIAAIEQKGIVPDVILLDGNPLHLDSREVNVIKGDAQSASIAAASIVAKVARDSLMEEYDTLYPGYGFASHKGYGSKEHRDAIESLGLSPIHRRSFCSFAIQETLF